MVLNSSTRFTIKQQYSKIPYYSKYKHGYTFDHLIYLLCICKISLVQSKQPYLAVLSSGRILIFDGIAFVLLMAR